jgi:thioredoxin-dependent peroxiredoxin
MSKVEVGKKLPAFSADVTGGGRIASKDLAGRAYVLYFYPKDNTPGCTTESQDFRDRHEQFLARKVAIFGVSRDSLASHDRFRDKQQLPFQLISDTDETLCRLFDVIREKNMYGRKVMGIERSTFLVSADGRLVREWRKVRVPGHVDEVLDAVHSL